MSTSYRLFFVTTWWMTPGKYKEASAWHEDALELWSRLPGVKGIASYVPQFSLSDDTRLEVWTEIDDYAVLDQWDAAMADMGDEFLALGQKAADCVTQGPSRLMGDLVGSRITDLQEA